MVAQNYNESENAAKPANAKLVMKPHDKVVKQVAAELNIADPTDKTMASIMQEDGRDD